MLKFALLSGKECPKNKKKYQDDFNALNEAYKT